MILGFVELQNPDAARKQILDLQQQVIKDPYFQDFPSINRTALAFHAKDDVPEIRYAFFKLLTELDFQAQFVVARKIERVFRNSFHANEGEFYDHLVTHLFERVLHRYEKNHIYFAKRGSRSRQAPLLQALQKSVGQFEEKWKTKVQSTYEVHAQTPVGEPCLSIVDYMNWAVFRAFTRGEMRSYRVVESKVSLLVDLYDTAHYPKNWYNRQNPFDINKITPL